MTGRPQRGRPKLAVQFYVDEVAYRCVLPLLECLPARQRSFSRLVEAILLLGKNEYVSNTSRDFIGELCLMKKHQIEEGIAIQGKRPKRRLHLTIDSEALGFLDMLVTRYRPVLPARGDAMSLMLRRVGERLTTREKTNWMKRRLEEILLKYPVRY